MFRLPFNTLTYVEKNLPGKFCPAPWTTVNILENGNVVSCLCEDWTSYPIGNLFENTLEEIYANSEKLNNIKRSVLDGKFSWCKVGHCNYIDKLPEASSNPFEKFNIERQPFLPTQIRLGLDANCNLKCASCRDKLLYSKTENPRTVKILESLVKSYKNFDKPVEIIGDGTGDIFVSKSYEKVFWEGDLPDCWRVGFLTNGNLIKKRKNQLEKIRDKFCDFGIQICIDASTHETYKSIRGGDFTQVLEGFDTLKELGISFNLEFVLQRGNYKDLTGYRELAKKYNVFYSLQKLDQRGHMSQEWWNYNKIENNPDVDYEYLRDILTIMQSDGAGMCGGVQEVLRSIS